MVTERIGTACLLTALMLAWFMVLDIAGIDLGISLLLWAVVAPLLLFPLLGRLTRATVSRSRAELEEESMRRALTAIEHVRRQSDGSVQIIVDSCNRLLARSRTREFDVSRVGQEAATIRTETLRLSDALSRASRGAPDRVPERVTFDDAGRPFAELRTGAS